MVVLACEIVLKSFDNIKHIECFLIKIGSFYYDTTKFAKSVKKIRSAVCT